jgi:fucose 4-O-acetylase-like acetyltransferase
MAWRKTENREYWLDYVKLFACVLVVLGHFFQSMTAADILAESNFYLWFENTIYMFHVPLFFICSGYIYQKFGANYDIKKHGVNILKKAIALVLPYLMFSTATWAMKQFAAGSVNVQINDSLFAMLISKPTSPYWFIYCLFLLFAIIPVLKNEVGATVLLVITVMAKSIYIISDTYIHTRFPSFYKMRSGLCSVC